MKKLLGIVVLGLLLNNCAPTVFRSHGPEGGVISVDMFALHKNSPKKIQEIADKHPSNTNPRHIDVMHTIMERDFHVKSKDQSFNEAHHLANRGGFLPQLIDKHPFLKMMNKVLKRGEN